MKQAIMFIENNIKICNWLNSFHETCEFNVVVIEIVRAIKQAFNGGQHFILP